MHEADGIAPALLCGLVGQDLDSLKNISNRKDTEKDTNSKPSGSLIDQVQFLCDVMCEQAEETMRRHL